MTDEELKEIEERAKAAREDVPALVARVRELEHEAGIRENLIDRMNALSAKRWRELLAVRTEMDALRAKGGGQ